MRVGMTMPVMERDLDAALLRTRATISEVARDAWALAGERKPHLATSFWFALGPARLARLQVHQHLRRYMNWIPADYVDAVAPTTGWSGNEDELAQTLRAFEAIGADEVHLIPTSSDVDQLRRVAEVANDFL